MARKSRFNAFEHQTQHRKIAILKSNSFANAAVPTWNAKGTSALVTYPVGEQNLDHRCPGTGTRWRGAYPGRGMRRPWPLAPLRRKMTKWG